MDAPWSSRSPWDDDGAAAPPLASDDPWASAAPSGAEDEALDDGFRALSASEPAAPRGVPDADTSSDRAVPEEDDGAMLSSSQADPWAAPDSVPWSSTVEPRRDDDWAAAATDDTWGGSRPLEPADTPTWTATAPIPSIRGTHMDRDAMDTLKHDARELVSSVHGTDDFAPQFAPAPTTPGFGELFGSEGGKRELVVRLDTPPAALIGSDGVSLNLGAAAALWLNSRTTREKLALAVQRTEHRTVKLTAPESSGSWLRPDPVRIASPVEPHDSRPSPDANESSSGPGWTHTSAQDAKPGAGGFIASLFKQRQQQPAAHMRKTSSTHSRPSADLAPPAAQSVGAYRDDEAASSLRYSDDPTGPDLMSLGEQSAPTTSAAAAPSLLSRWRSSGIFARTPTPPSAASSSGDTGWTRSFSKTGLRNTLDEPRHDSGRYFDDDEASPQPERYNDAYSDDEDVPRAKQDDAFSGLWDSVPASKGPMLPPPAPVPKPAPPLSTSNRSSLLPPPPRSAAPAFQDLLFDDFEPTPPPPKKPPAPPAPPPSHGRTASGALTADDLLFFDNL